MASADGWTLRITLSTALSIAAATGRVQYVYAIDGCWAYGEPRPPKGEAYYRVWPGGRIESRAFTRAEEVAGG